MEHSAMRSWYFKSQILRDDLSSFKYRYTEARRSQSDLSVTSFISRRTSRQDGKCWLTLAARQISSIDYHLCRVVTALSLDTCNIKFFACPAM